MAAFIIKIADYPETWRIAATPTLWRVAAQRLSINPTHFPKSSCPNGPLKNRLKALRKIPCSTNC